MKLGRRLGALLGGGPPSPVDGATTDADEPCIPCGEGKEVRQFSLNPAPPREVHDDDVLHVVPGRQFVVVDGQVVLYDPASIRSHVLNPSAAAVWATVDGRRTVGEIIDSLEADTGVDRATLDPDVRRALAGFYESRIVDDGPTPPADPNPDLDLPPVPVVDRAARRARGLGVIRRLLDQQPWSAVVGPVRAAGIDVVVRTDEPTTADALVASLAALPSPSPVTGHPGPADDDATEPVVLSVHDAGRDHPRRYRLYVDGDRQWTGTTPSDLVANVLSEITRLATAGTPDHLLWHAGGVERGGRVVAIAGQSGQGKSTLTAALVQRGFAYLTDELLAIEPTTATALPYPKALDLDPPSCALLGLFLDATVDTGKDRQPVPVAELGRSSTGGQLALVVLLDDEIVDGEHADASPAVRDVLDLIGVTFGETFTDELALEALAGIAASVPLLRLERGPLDQMASQVEAALGA